MEIALLSPEEYLQLQRLAVRYHAIRIAKIYCLHGHRRIDIDRDLWEQCVDWFEEQLLAQESNEHLRNVVVEELPYSIPRN